MKDTNIQFIQKLTKSDKKTLGQKTLKVQEETGELAREVLPFEDAHATTHRFGTKEKILEETADVALTVLSIAFELGFTYDDFEQMVERKMMKWAELQKRHNKAGFPVPFEIHISVKNVNQEEFRQVCKALDVKPIVLALQVGQQELKDVMTSSKHFGNNGSAYQEMKRISEGLRRAGFNVVREKIETVPWHPAAPSSSHENPTMPEDCYFEQHVSVFITKDMDLEPLAHVAEQHRARLSRNAFKSMEDGYTQMITYRRYDGVYETFMENAQLLREAIKHAGFKITDVVTEFSLFDTEVKHDAVWIGKE